jgi:iron-sulfur cluster assembly accessory protein
MTVGKFDPQAFDSQEIVVTEAARAHMESQVARSGQQALRLGVKESGCNGYMYTLDYIDAPAEDDLQVATGGTLRLYVRRGDLPLVGGTRVDYVREGLNASLKFKNPNAESHCGCGESFAVHAAAS